MSQGDFLLLLGELLEQVGIPFMVTGSHASSRYGQPRVTQDADLVIDPTSEQLEQLLALLGDRFYLSPEGAREALARRSMFNVIDFDAGWKADLIVRKDRPFSVEELARRQPVAWHGGTLPVATPEDTILSKLEWNRITPSERQVQDALHVAAVQWPSLDRDYLRRWPLTSASRTSWKRYSRKPSSCTREANLERQPIEARSHAGETEPP